jgi:hypothetical protein
LQRRRLFLLLEDEALEQGLEALEANSGQRIHLENNLLFPRAIELEDVMRSALAATPGDPFDSCQGSTGDSAFLEVHTDFRGG